MHQVKQNITRADKPDVIKTTLLLFNHITESIQQTIWKIEKKNWKTQIQTLQSK